MSDQPQGELRFRSIDQLEVHYPQRMIEMVVTPYEAEALVEMKGRIVTELFSAGAYDGIERRANRVKVNRDHDLKRTVGGAVAFHPSRAEGLVAELKISKTELGDETLALAADGWLDASAGYRPMAGGETWETRDRVRITKAWLGHIALTPDPAYESAKVLAVRHNGSSGSSEGTPNLDVVRGWLMEDRLAKLQASGVSRSI